jgi:uncharacterized protein YbaR (Trm112 family)
MNVKSMKDDNYVCPVCKQPLSPTANGLRCQREGVEYPIKNGIVDFVTEDLTKSTNFFFKFADKIVTLRNSTRGRRGMVL